MGRRRLNTCLAATLLVTFVMALVVLVIIGGYKLNWDWAGFNGKIKSGKTLWDWLQLLVIPLALAIIAILFNRSERKNEQRIATDNQQEAALQEYIKDMSGLLLEKDLRKSEVDAEVRKIARIRTLTVLHRLDKDRKMNIVQFLCASGLIDKNEPIVDLEGANLNRVHFFGVYLDGTSLKGAHLREAHLEGTPLRGTNLEGADLTKAVLSMSEVNKVDFRRAFIPKATYFVLNQPGKAFLSGYFEGMAKRWSKNNLLTEANLSHALLTEANLCGANLTKADLHSAFLVNADLQNAQLSGANLHSAILVEANLQGANLQGANLQGADLQGANLQGANLQGSILNNSRLRMANLSKANLSKADLRRATLVGVILIGADLSESDLGEADLSRTRITQEQLKQTKSLKGATMPDGKINQ